MSELSSLNVIKQIIIVIKQLASWWLELIEIMCENAQFNVLIDIASTLLSDQHAIVLMLFYHKLWLMKMNNIQTVLSLYLYQDEIWWQVINLFCQCDLMISYKIFQHCMKNLINEIKRKIQVIDQSLTEIVTYDNFDFAEEKREKWMNDSCIMRSITISLMFREQDFNDDALRQNMWCLITFSLLIMTIVNELKLNDIDKQINFLSLFLICSCNLSWLTFLNLSASFRIYHSNSL